MMEGKGGKSYPGMCIKNTWAKPKGVGSRVVSEDGCDGGRKWRQL